MGGLGTDIVEERLRVIERDGPSPESLVRILSIVQDQGTTATDLAVEISTDEALSAELLDTVNAGPYGAYQHVRSIAEAVVVLGFSEVERLALALSVNQVFNRKKSLVHVMRSLWRHSLACSVIASVIEEHLRHDRPQVRGAHVAGLLHDMGKAVIVEHFPEVIPDMFELLEAGHTSCDAERAVLGGYSHCDIGGIVARRWNLPECLIQCIERHHDDPARVAGNSLCQAVHLADQVSKKLGYPAMPVRRDRSADTIATDLLHLGPGLLEQFASQLDRARGPIGALSSTLH